MARPGGKEVGRVNIRAVPDSTKFRIDLKKMLDRVERTVNVSLPVAADTRPAESTLKRFEKDWNGRKITLAAGVGTAAARAQLTALTRPRIASVIVRVRKASLAKAAALLAAFSGARVAGDLVKNLAERLENLDRALPKAAFVSTAIANVTSVVLNALGGILATGQGFVQLLGLLGAAPGILTGMAVGGLALGLALADVKDELGVLAPGFKRLQDVVSRNFWAVARRPIIDFVRATLPEFRAGLALTSTAVGKWAATVVQQIGKAFGGGRIEAMFKPLIQSINIASTGASGFAQAIAVLGQVGGSYLPRLAQWVADLSNRFGAFLLQAEADGSLQAFIETGITAAKELGSVLFSLGSIFSGLTAAMGGGGGFGPLADGLARIAEIVNGPTFQSTLRTIFVGAEAGADGLAAALLPIGAMLTALSPLIANILSSSGQVLGQFLGDVASALSSPAFSVGLRGFFDGILSGIKAIGPSLPAIASGFGSLLKFAGELAAVLGPVLGKTLETLAPILSTILDTLGSEALPRLADSLLSAFDQIGPALIRIVEAIANSELIPALLDLIEAVLPGLATGIELIAGAVGFLMQPSGLPSLGSVLKPIIAAVNEWLLALSKGKLPIEEFGAVIASVFGGIGEVVSSMVNIVRGHLNGFLSLLEDGLNNAIFMINTLAGGLNNVLAGIAIATGGAISLKVGLIPSVSLPRLETGGDILGSQFGTALIAGENFQDESVVNRGRTNRLIELTATLAAKALALGESPGGSTFNIYEAVSPQATALAVARRQERRRA
jgi:phage-related protein